MNTTISNTELKIKPEFKDLIPPPSKEELEGLEKNILANGCEQPIKLWQGFIVDGHNRYHLCSKHTLPFKTEELKRENENQVILWIIDHQLDRRNISLFSRGRLINRKRAEYAKAAEERMLSGVAIDPPQNSGEGSQCSDRRSRETDRKLAKESGISHDTLSRIAKIEEKATPEQKKALEKNETSINEVFTKISKEEKREARQEKLREMEFPKGKYRVIYADPPWDYGSSPTAKNTATPDLKYPVMSLEDICKMPVKEIADENAVLFLWATSYHLFQSKEVLDAWGFIYKSIFVWDKVKHNMGCYNSVRSEFLLIATKGSCTPDNLELIDSVQSIERTRHSEKPEEFRHIIETLYKYGNKVELFARKQTEGWNVYGNEV